MTPKLTPEQASNALEAAEIGARSAWKRFCAYGTRVFDVEDLLQEARMEIWRQQGRFDPAKGDLGSFARQVGFAASVQVIRSTWGRDGAGISVVRTPFEEDLRTEEDPAYDQEDFLEASKRGVLHFLQSGAKWAEAARAWMDSPCTPKAVIARAAGVDPSAINLALGSARRKYLATPEGRSAKAVA